MFLVKMPDAQAKATSRALTAAAEAAAAWGAFAAHNASFVPGFAKAAFAAEPETAAASNPLDWVSEASSLYVRAHQATWAAGMEALQSFSAARPFEVSSNPFGLTGYFTSAAPEAPASKAPAPRAPKADVEPATDDLTQIKGVGPKLAQTLHGFGIFSIRQIAELTDKEIAALDEQLTPKGRVVREGWVEQAKALLAAA